MELNSQSSVDFVQGNNDWPDTDGGWPVTSFIYSTDCYNDNFDCANFDITESSIIKKHLIKTLDILGRETTNNKGFQLHIYDDGSIEKKYVIK